MSDKQPQVMIWPRGQLHPKDKERLTKLGIVAVEADDPSKVVAVIPGMPMLSGDDILLAAVESLSQSTYSQGDYFIKKIRDLVRLRHPLADALAIKK